MIKHKILSILLILSMIISVLSAPMVYASDIPGITVVGDFRTEGLHQGVKGGSASQSNTVGYEDSTNSLCWKMSAEMEFAPGLEFDWKSNSRVHIRFRGEEADLKFNIIFMDTTTKPWGKYKQYATVTTGEWQEVSFPVSELLFVINNISNQKAIGCILFNANGWGTTDYSKHKNIYIDQIWLTSADYGQLMAAPTCSVPYGAGYVEPDLGGTNALSFEFEMNIFASDNLAECFKLYEVNGETETESDIAFDASASGKTLTVSFTENLKSPCVYKAALDSSRIYSTGGAKLEEDFVTYFSVGMGSIIFTADSSTPENGAEGISADVAGFEWKVNFNNDLNPDPDLNDYITVYKEEVRMFDGFSLSADGKTLTATFDEVLGYDTSYTLKISESFTDAYGNEITGSREFGFTTAGEAEEASTVNIFSAGNPEHMAAVISRSAATENTGNLNINSKNAKISFDTKDKSAYMTRDEAVNTTGMKYLNLWLYSPEATEYKCNVVLYPQRASSTTYHRYEVPVDWEGWKLVSINIGSKASIDSVMINFNGWQNLWPEGGYVLVDEIWYSAGEPAAPYLVESSFPDGYDKAALNGESLVLTFSGLSEIQNNAVVEVKDTDGNEFTDFTYAFDSDRLIVSFGTLAVLTQYQISVNGLSGTDTVIQTRPVVLSFKSVDGGIYASDLAFSKTALEALSNLEFTAKVHNMNPNARTVRAFAAAYNVDGCLAAFKASVISAQSGITDISLSLDEIPAGSDYAKAWITDSSDYVLSNKFITLSTKQTENLPGKLSGSAPKAEITSSEVDIRTLTVKGTASGIPDCIIIEVNAPNGDLISSDIITAASDGSFSHGLRLSADAPSGVYKVKVYHGAAKAEAKAGYVSDADREKLLSLANGTDEDALSAFLKENSEILGIEDFSSKRISDLSVLIIEKGKYESYTVVTEMLANLISVLDGLNASLWSELADYIIQNTDLLFEKGDKDAEYFNDLGSKAKNEICQILFDYLPFETVSDFRKTFSAVTDDYKDSQEDKKESSKGSSGGGGGGSGKVSGSATVGGSVATPAPYTPIESAEAFKDLSGYEWARDSIMTLYSKGIISPAANNLYRPGDNITREEFVKLIIEAFFSDRISSGNAIYTDAADGAWYNKYLSAAADIGVVKGKPDGSFGIGESITREDMATIACRALEALGENMTSATDALFTDSAYISDYALSYVNALAETGVINGMGDGSFAPKANANRAQAAKIIAGLVKLYK